MTSFENFKDLLDLAKAEDVLFSKISKSTYKALGLPPFTFPHRYQDLPRVSTPELPDHLLPHPNFKDLSLLKKRLLDKAILWLYQESKTESSLDIVILSYVIPGGLGDYFAGLFTVNLLQNAFPDLHFTYMAIIPTKAPSLPFPDQASFYPVYFSSEESLSLKDFSERDMSCLKKSSLILQLPTVFPLFDELKLALQKDSTPHFSTIGEYGFIHSSQFNPTTSTRCLGLHFLELGLFIKDEQSKKMTNPLADFLGESPHNPPLKFFFAYLYTRAGHELYLHMLLKSLKDSLDDIHLCTPDVGKFLLVLQKIEKGSTWLKRFKRYGISSISLYLNQKSCEIRIQEKGKKFSLYHLGALSHEKFLHFLEKSEEPIGIRGNLSVSEALSMGKTFFYDPIEHNVTFHLGLVAIAKKRLQKFSSTLTFLKYSGATKHLAQAGEHLGRTALNPKTAEGFKALSKIIKEDHRANELLGCLIKRELLHKKTPHLKEKEEALKEAFAQDTLSLTKVIQELRLAIMQASS